MDTPAWLPSAEIIENANITQFMNKHKFTQIKELHQFSVQHYEKFWQLMLTQLNIQFKKAAEKICDLSAGIESPKWLPQATMNIIDSCFIHEENAAAILYLDKQKHITKFTFGELDKLSNRIANSLIAQGFTARDPIAIAMPITFLAIAIYLGIIKMGGVVVSIADSFSSDEMTVRLKIAKAKAIFTQDVIDWGGKKLPLFEKIKNVGDMLPAVVLPCDDVISVELRANDKNWNDFLSTNDKFVSIACDPMSACNILFSSGTTGDPKAIPWNHTTPIKVASDAFFHQNIQPGDVLAWPTNLGWMMGPWLIFAALINGATIALYADAPKDRRFGEFIQNAKVTMLGVVPTLVASWRESRCMEKLDWSAIKVFSSTGECSNSEDMFYLMSLANHKPVIEYCGGTEIGGAYVSSTVIEKNYPSLFSTKVMGIDFAIIDEEGKLANTGEVAIIPPSIGLSTELLNADQHKVYYADMPMVDGKLLRRHGDQITLLPNGYYAILGRVDDTMNLGGIKISAAEIERAIAGIIDITETAAIAIAPPGNGPSQLIIYACTQKQLDKQIIMLEMQQRINQHLNPLFKIHDIIFTNDLPKTASNKIMRRMLRKKYMEKNTSFS